MKALDLALIEAELEAAELSDSTREFLQGQVTRYARLEVGRRHLEVVRYIEAALGDGFTLYGYAIPTATSLFQFKDQSSVEEIWTQYRKFWGETPGICHLKSAS